MDREKEKLFLGTGEKNLSNQSLEEFLDKYDPSEYQNPSNTVDTLVFTYIEEDNLRKISRVLMIKRGNHPGIGWWALPGGFVEFRENLDDAARRELKEETGIEDIEMEQLGCFGDYDRDPRTRIITVAYVALVKEGTIKAVAGDDAAETGWFEISDCLISGNDGYEKHHLTMKEKDKNVELCADVEVTWRPGSILQNRKYIATENNLLCADHGAIILEGYHYLKKLLAE